MARLSALLVVSVLLAVASTLAVHHDATVGVPGGSLGALITALEVVFIAGIIPLVCCACYCSATLLALAVRARHEARRVPRAKAR